jgi:hypothetical protein
MKPRKSKYICKFTSNTVHCGKMWYITQNTALIEAHACDKSVLNMVVIQRDMRKIKVLSFSPEDGDNFFLRNVDTYLWVQEASQPRTTSSSSTPWHPHRLMRAITYDSQIGSLPVTWFAWHLQTDVTATEKSNIWKMRVGLLRIWRKRKLANRATLPMYEADNIEITYHHPYISLRTIRTQSICIKLGVNGLNWQIKQIPFCPDVSLQAEMTQDSVSSGGFW